MRTVIETTEKTKGVAASEVTTEDVTTLELKPEGEVGEVTEQGDNVEDEDSSDDDDIQVTIGEVKPQASYE